MATWDGRQVERARTQHDVGKYLLVGHLNVADGDAEAQHLLQLKLDRRAHFNKFVGEVLSMGYRRREFAS
jgi:hypothetical protein